MAVEQGSTLGWERYVGPSGRIIGMKTFGASAPLKELQRIFLRRSPRNELEFAEFITAFGWFLYDGTNGVASAADRGTVTPTLPKRCYRDHRSVIVHVIVLRNYYLHALSPNVTTAAEHLASASDVFELYVAKRLPDDTAFAAMRVGMLTAATRFVDRLAAHVPVGDAVNAEAVFANRNEKA